MATLPNSLALINKAGNVVFWFPKAKQLVVSLKRQKETSFTYHPFHTEKAMIIFSEPWNEKSLCSNTGWTTVGNACRGLLEVDKATMNMDNLLEAKIKVRYNYSGFIRATIRIEDKDGHFFVVHMVTICSGKWLAERDVKIHGSFKRQDAIEFDNFNPKAEQFNGIRRNSYGSTWDWG
ncbi:hypothetical protein E5676_scaffold556G00250 [Cucumis melo var. makuwa]|uniref:Uncharacterized protein n=1 Tax=Cucumis melo var. makuwa TaxID=1194695 RepID=A0A5D3CNM2_CUCMM|nr:hypothetical protein E6C27_scaffold205G00610 [Cucumis melo var. makuwa]TYK13487.1 hypothetical protein E5676_scaffold556G00250 [Cucumis melo var. makuwa]